MKCQQKDCTSDACTVFIWPGGGPIGEHTARQVAACISCALRAVHVARAMGFELPFRENVVRALEAIESAQAREVVHLVKTGLGS